MAAPDLSISSLYADLVTSSPPDLNLGNVNRVFQQWRQLSKAGKDSASALFNYPPLDLASLFASRLAPFTVKLNLELLKKLAALPAVRDRVFAPDAVEARLQALDFAVAQYQTATRAPASRTITFSNGDALFTAFVSKVSDGDGVGGSRKSRKRSRDPQAAAPAPVDACETQVAQVAQVARAAPEAQVAPAAVEAPEAPAAPEAHAAVEAPEAPELCEGTTDVRDLLSAVASINASVAALSGALSGFGQMFAALVANGAFRNS